EYYLILYLLSLPFLLYFYNNLPLFFWILLIFVDIAGFMLLDVYAIIPNLTNKEFIKSCHRLILYLVTIVIAYVFLATQSFSLLLIVLANEAITEIIAKLVHDYRKEHYFRDKK
ncbi:MAG: hypothetical protein RSG07_02330, partial [Erysipelotrichaceae bacterium]